MSYISAKTLSGDIITLEAYNKEEFINSYKQKYIKETERPFVTITLLDNEDNKDECVLNISNISNIIVNLHDLPYFIDLETESKNKQKNLILNQHPNALDLIIKSEEWKKSFTIFSNRNAINLIKNLLDDMKEVTDDLSLIYLAKNTNDEALDILSTFNKNYFMDEVWYELCANKNPKAFEIILENMDYINSKDCKDDILFHLNLCENVRVVEYLEDHNHLINWIYFSENPIAIELLLKNKDKIYYKGLCRNPHSEAVKIIKRIIKQEGFESKKIDYFKLFDNTSEDMINFIKENLDKIDKRDIEYQKDVIYQNKSALSLIEELYKKGYKITSTIWSNEGIFRCNN